MKELLKNYIESVRLSKQEHSDSVVLEKGCFKPFVGVLEGRKYHKVYYTLDGEEGQRSVHTFIDMVTGDVFASKSWKQKGRLIDSLRNYN